MKVTLQSQATECGLACLAMVGSHHGRTLTLSQLRRKFPVSLKGMNLDALIRCAGALEFVTRALRLEINELQGVQLPCILHWRFNHFVVLERIDKTGFDILDPAVGKCRVTPEEFDRAFTGVALELHPVREFERSTPTRERLRELVGTVTGLRTALARIAITALALQVLAIVSPLFNQLIIDEAIAKQDMNLATVLMIGFGLLLVTQTIIGQVKAWMSISLAQELALQWRTNVFAHLLKLPTSYFEGRHIGDITSRMSAVTQIQQRLTNSVVNAVVNALMAVGCGLMMVGYSWNLAGVAAIAAMLYGLLRFASYAPFRQATSERIRISAHESTHVIETLRAVQSIKIFRKEASRLASWQNICVEGQNRDVRTAKMSQWFSTARTALTGAQGLVIFWLGAKAIIGGPSSGGALTIGMFFAFNAYQKQFSDAVSTLVDFFVEIKMLDLQRERLSDILDSVPECAEHSFAPVADGDIEIHNLGFRYSDTEPWIFRNISFTIRKGELFGISGPSGLGKSTLLKVILGVLEPSEGEIRYAGLQVESIGRKAYRAKFAAVMQNDILLGGSIADNIAYFEDSDNFDKIARCASAAGIAEDIAMMPMGYESLIGDLGSGVSGGQLQRIMLARALFAEAPILVLDEAMSNLDSETEKKIISTLKSIECTRIFVTHRHESLRHADRAFRLDRGSAVELDKSSNFLLAKV